MSGLRDRALFGPLEVGMGCLRLREVPSCSRRGNGNGNGNGGC